LPGVNQELADLHHGAIEAFGGVIDVLQTGSSAAVPRWNAALDATNWWLSMAEQVASLERRSDGPTRSAVKRLSSKLLTLGYCLFSSTGEPTLRSASTGYWKGAGFMPLTRGEAVGCMMPI
jgi:hypothetical protein